ncbi:hypothetical protein MUK42_12794 [Musa troglodytarum]|uniref:Uncharacterized protein n=1 Tax=Musa troglodytarum TaxID=320322 RepID=A0A9E7K1R3_9LILI|nr:hypothetical protein MUK42_12794 [Musa troglodytarum]
MNTDFPPSLSNLHTTSSPSPSPSSSFADPTPQSAPNLSPIRRHHRGAVGSPSPRFFGRWNRAKNQGLASDSFLEDDLGFLLCWEVDVCRPSSWEPHAARRSGRSGTFRSPMQRYHFWLQMNTTGSRPAMGVGSPGMIWPMS